MLAPIRVSATLNTAASPAAVWSVFESAPRWPEVLTDLIEARIDPDGKLVKGAVIRSRARPNTGAIDMRYEVADAIPGERLILATHWKGLRAWTHYVFEANGQGTRDGTRDGIRDGTRVTVTSEMQGENLFSRVVMAVSRRRYSTQLETALQTRTRKLLDLAERL